MADMPRYGHVDRAYGMKLATTPAEDDGPIWIVNLMKYRDTADYTDGRQSSISGREADDLYAPVDVLREIGAEVVFAARLEAQQGHREVAIADTYTMILRPTINRIAESIGG